MKTNKENPKHVVVFKEENRAEIKSSCLVVAPHSVAESFIRHNLSFPVEKSQEAFLHRLQLLLVNLRRRRDDGGGK